MLPAVYSHWRRALPNRALGLAKSGAVAAFRQAKEEGANSKKG